MKVKQAVLRSNQCSRQRLVLVLVLACAVVFVLPLTVAHAASVVLWDTGAPLTRTGVPASRTGWKALPTELFAFEAEPAKVASDPGYSGREYAFKSDVVVENQSLVAVSSVARGSVGIYAKGGRLIAEAVPIAPSAIRCVAIVRNAGDEVVLKVSYSGAGESAVFSFGRSDIVEMKPTCKLKGLRLLSPMQYGVLPAFIGDDLIYDPAAFPEVKSLAVPSENLFLGLQPGGDRVLVVTWPKGRQQVQLGLSGAADKRRIESLDIQGDGQSFFLASLAAPGIWHREQL